MSLISDRIDFIMDFDSSYVVYREGVIGYRGSTNKKKVPKVSSRNLALANKLLTPKAVKRLYFKKKPHKLIKTITRL